MHNTNIQLKLSSKFSQFLYSNLTFFLCLTCNLLHKSRTCRLRTVNLKFTQINPGGTRIPLRIRRMIPVAVVNDVSPVVRTGDVDRIRYRCSSVDGVPKTHNSVFFDCCVGNVDRES